MLIHCLIKNGNNNPTVSTYNGYIGRIVSKRMKEKRSKAIKQRNLKRLEIEYVCVSVAYLVVVGALFYKK